MFLESYSVCWQSFDEGLLARAGMIWGVMQVDAPM